MAIDPHALHAFVSNPAADASAAADVEDGAEEEAPPAEAAPPEGESDAPPVWYPLIPQLIENIDDVMESADEVSQDALIDTSMDFAPEDAEALTTRIASLPRPLQNALRECAEAGALKTSTEDIAQMLAGNGSVDEEPERLAGWLYRVGEVLGGAEGEHPEPDGDEDPMGNEPPNPHGMPAPGGAPAL